MPPTSARSRTGLWAEIFGRKENDFPLPAAGAFTGKRFLGNNLQGEALCRVRKYLRKVCLSDYDSEIETIGRKKHDKKEQYFTGTGIGITSKI